MRPISPIERLFRSLRTKTADRKTRTRERARLADAEAASAAPAQATDPSPAVHAAQRIEAIDKEDAERKPRVFRAFLEAGLLEHIDAPTLADPAFQALLDKVHQSLFNDPALEITVHRVVKLLSNSADDGSLAQDLQAALEPESAPEPPAEKDELP